MGKKMAGPNGDYEECRRQRMEENRKRMEELHLNKLAAALQVKQSKMRAPRNQPERSSVPVRRSSRTANKPAPIYNEVYGIDPSGRVRRAYAIKRAEQLQSSLDAELPSFIKPMLKSHVTGGKMSLPINFCHKHLLHHDNTVTLVDEDGEKFGATYIFDWNSFTSGWRGFSITHNLVGGDTLLFQLIEPLTFKVHIVRAYDSEEKEAEVSEEEEAEDHERRRKQKTIKRRKGKQMSDT